MKWILFYLISFSSLSIAANFTKGDGKFLSKDGDGHQFIKEQLIHEGIKSIVSKELENLQLNKELFWNKYNDKLEERYKQIEENFRQSQNIDENTDAKKLVRFEERLRIKKLKFRKRYANMHNMLPKYVIKKISRSPKNPKYRFIKMEGKIDTKLLTKVYYNLVRGKKRSDYGSLFLISNYELSGISYTELGIDNENDFEGEVTKNWLDWFSKNKPLNIANAEIMDEEKKSKLNEYLKVPTESMLSAIPDVFVNSLLLDIEINIKKKKFEKSTGTYNFEYSGYAYLKDLQTNLVLGTYKFSKVQKSYRSSGEINIANLVANHVYQMAKGYFPQIQTRIKDITPVSTIQRLRVTNFQNMKQLNKFVQLIRERGVKYSLKVKLDLISREYADLILFYDGEIEDLKALFTSIKSAKKDLSFDLIDTNNALGIKFNREVEKI